LSPPPKTSCSFQPFHIWHEPDPFFKDLKLFKSKGSVQYRRGRDAVANFPQSTTLKVELSQGAPQLRSCIALPAFDPAEVQFRVEWKNDSQTVPAEGKFVLSKEPSSQTWCEEQCVARWSYELKIDSQGVPLQSDLVVRIEAQDGTRLVEYVGKLTTADLQAQAPFYLPGQP
jgi:hypothetical protein